MNEQLITIRKNSITSRGTGIRGLMRGMATIPQGNQELLVVIVVSETKLEDPEVSLG